MASFNLGIDLGTRTSCVGVLRRGYVDVIPTATGARTIPTFIAFTDAGRLFGEAAASQVCGNMWHGTDDHVMSHKGSNTRIQAAVNPVNTIYDFKRLLGRRFSDPFTTSLIATWPFRVVCGEDDEPLVEVAVRGEAVRLSAVQLAGMFLGHLKSFAEAQLGGAVASATLSAPCAGGLFVRSALIDACVIAGLPPSTVTAYAPMLAVRQYAALHGERLGLARAAGGRRAVVLVDAGAGGCDILVAAAAAAGPEAGGSGGGGTLIAAGHAHCAAMAGSDVDAALVEKCAAEFARATGGRDVRRNHKAMSRLRAACERAKHQLAFSRQATVDLDNLLGDADFNMHLTREDLDTACAAGVARLPGALALALQAAASEPGGISEVVLLGGASRLPGVQAAVQAFFAGRELGFTLNADEAVACGAALASERVGSSSSEAGGGDPVECVLATVGIAGDGGHFEPLLRAGQATPARQCASITTTEDAQSDVFVRVYEGDRNACSENALLLIAKLSGVPRRPRGFRVPFRVEMTTRGAVTVACTELPGVAVTLRHVSTLGREELDALRAREQRWAAVDRRAQASLEARADLEAYAFAARRAAEGDPRGAAVTAAATAALEWLDSALITDLAETDSALASLVAAVREARLLRPPAAPARSVAEPPAPASSASPASPSQPPGRMSIAPWACAACTFINEDSLAAECAVCESPRAASAASAAGAGEAAPGSATGRRRRSLEGDAEAARLQAELDRVLAERQCGVCLDRPKDTALGCGHRLCGECARPQRVCPFCRAIITQRIRTYE